MSVLLIVDRGMFAEALSSVLVDRDVEVVGIVDRPDDVVEAAASTRPSVVVLDMESRIGRRIDVGRAVRRAAPEAKVIALTPRSDGGLVQRAVALGFYGSLNKDTDMGALVTTIRKVADGGPMVTPGSPRSVARGSPDERLSELLISQLTPRELQVIRLMATAASSQEIGSRLSISVNTVRSHIQSIFTKLQVHSRLGAVAFAAAHDLLSPPVPVPILADDEAYPEERGADRSTG